MTAKTVKTTHELFIHRVREIVLDNARREGVIEPELIDALAHAKLLYGIGSTPGARGVCHYDAWENGVGKVAVIEIAAITQESWVQLAGTTIHELGHVLAGWGHGHDAEWKDATRSLGFVKRPDAAGQVYRLALFAPAIRHAIYALAAEIGDGSPAFSTFGSVFGGLAMVRPRPCGAGTGTKGGKSRGTGSGSRLRLWECECERPVKVRVASDDFKAHCDTCGEPFSRKS
jgi:hypothetical protein